MTTFIWDLDGTLIDSYEVFLEALSESNHLQTLTYHLTEKQYIIL